MRLLCGKGTTVAFVLAIACFFSAGVKGAGEARWFGLSEGDFGRVHEFAGDPLKVKARFAGIMEPSDEDLKSRRPLRKGMIFFLAETAAGELICEMEDGGRPARHLRAMKRATPLFLRGTLDPRTYILRVNKLTQGWGRERTGGGSKP